MTDFQFAFLCIFGLSLVVMVVVFVRRENDANIYTLTDDQTSQSSPSSYTVWSASDPLPEWSSAPAQTALEFAKVYARYAFEAAEQLAKTGEIAKEDRKEKAVEILCVYLKAQGFDPNDDSIVPALPYLIESCVYQEHQPLF